MDSAISAPSMASSISSFRSIMEITTKDQYKIHYQDKGRGRVLVFLHGNGEDGSCFNAQLEYFSKGFRVIIPDSRGHGRSEGAPGKLNLPMMAEDVRELIRQLKLEEYFLIGFSDGANIAMELASGPCPGLSGLVLAGGNLRPWGMKPGVLAGVIREYLLTVLFSVSDRKRWEKARILGLMLFEPRLGMDALGRIAVPTLVLAGEQDMIRKGETLKIARAIRGSRLEIFPDADHFFIYSQPERFNKMLESWICGIIERVEKKK